MDLNMKLVTVQAATLCTGPSYFGADPEARNILEAKATPKKCWDVSKRGSIWFLWVNQTTDYSSHAKIIPYEADLMLLNWGLLLPPKQILLT